MDAGAAAASPGPADLPAIHNAPRVVPAPEVVGLAAPPVEVVRAPAAPSPVVRAAAPDVPRAPPAPEVVETPGVHRHTESGPTQALPAVAAGWPIAQGVQQPAAEVGAKEAQERSVADAGVATVRPML